MGRRLNVQTLETQFLVMVTVYADDDTDDDDGDDDDDKVMK